MNGKISLSRKVYHLLLNIDSNILLLLMASNILILNDTTFLEWLDVNRMGANSKLLKQYFALNTGNLSDLSIYELIDFASILDSICRQLLRPFDSIMIKYWELYRLLPNEIKPNVTEFKTHIPSKSYWKNMFKTEYKEIILSDPHIGDYLEDVVKRDVTQFHIEIQEDTAKATAKAVAVDEEKSNKCFKCSEPTQYGSFYCEKCKSGKSGGYSFSQYFHHCY